MAKRMLIDATHAEETRVVVLNGTRLEEFDVETSTKKQLKGNIYLAKIVRVEPSLQAAFIDYGGNRHGFLAFNEIHPDYYQIPVADRQALLAEQREVMKRSAATGDFADGDNDDASHHASFHEGPTEPDSADAPAATAPASGEEANGHADNGGHVEMVGGDETEEVERRRPKPLRNYKIQEVIKRRQIVLVQVVKEERGNKGAALTTYLSLAGRYCVLMPNTARGGGVSRKITNAQDRKRLKSITNEMNIPEGMAVIVRTAGSERTKPEIKRDYEYLLRLWDSVRDLTLKSTAPALVYEEANLIKRSIRDLYSRDIDEILVDGDEGYRLAKDFMRMLTPSHARRVQSFKDAAMPLFHKFQVETQLDAMHSPVVQLKSGGYIVINQTEALVAIDVNSGRSTKERHIEETALKTNCEAADEVARQLRLRDLAGLIVIDFIDMEEPRNNHTVERRLKEAMRLDRARIQLGKISPFGLLELSRQRLRPSLMETSFQPCTHCGGTGAVRSVESASMHILRAIEEEGIRRRSSEITLTVHPSIALYILNQKRSALTEIENRYGFRVFLTGDDSLIPPAFRMERIKAETPIEIPPAKPPAIEPPEPEEAEEEDVEVEEAAADETKVAAAAETGTEEGDAGRRRRRRRRRRGRREENGQIGAAEAETTAEGETAAEENTAEAVEAEGAAEEEEGDEDTGIAVAEGEPSPRRRRRGKRGGRRRNRRMEGMPETGEDGEDIEHAAHGETEAGEQAPAEAVGSVTDEVAADTTAPTVEPEIVATEAEAPAEISEVPAAEAAAVSVEPAPAEESAPAAEAPAAEPAAKPKRTRSRKKVVAAEAPAETTEAAEAPAVEPPAKPKRPRAPRKKAAAAAVVAAESAAEPAVTEPTVAEPIAAESATPVAEAEQPPIAPVEQSPAEPSPAAEEPEDTHAGPPRRGWWNRAS